MYRTRNDRALWRHCRHVRERRISLCIYPSITDLIWLSKNFLETMQQDGMQNVWRQPNWKGTNINARSARFKNPVLLDVISCEQHKQLHHVFMNGIGYVMKFYKKVRGDKYLGFGVSIYCFFPSLLFSLFNQNCNFQLQVYCHSLWEDFGSLLY